MSRNEVVQLLYNLGFCEESASLYVHLLDYSPVSLTDLVSGTKVSEEQAIPLIGRLMASRLVFEDKGRYWVLNPRKAFKAFADEVLWSVTSTLSDSLDDVPEECIEDVKEVSETCRRLQTVASKRYTHRSPIAVRRIKVARDPDQLAALLAEAIDSAGEEILCVSTSPRQPQLSVIWGSLRGRIKEGVRYVRIVDIAEIVEHGFAIVKRDVEEVGVELYITDKDRINQKFYVIDDNFVVMFAHDRYSAYDFTLTGQVISNRLIIGDYRRGFNMILEDAIPAAFVLELMAEQRSKLLTRAKCANMSETEVCWLECLLDFGIYCKFREIDPVELASTLEHAKEEKLVVVSKNENDVVIPLPRYNWSIAQIRERWLADRQKH